MKFEGSEPDVKPDENVAESRETGGVPNDDDPNQGSTTSTSPDDTYVGRVAGQDEGYEGETGAEARSDDT